MTSVRPCAGRSLLSLFGGAALSAFLALLPASSLAADAAPDLDEMSLEQLMEMKVSTVYGAALYAQNVGEAPSSVTIITSEEIKRYGWRTLADVLSAVRSFWINDDRVYPFIGVRGMQRPGDYNSRVLVQLDGHSTNDNLYGGASCGNDAIVDLALVDRIEIIRGPGSSLYGTGAFFGVINLITRTGAEIGAVEIQGEAGSLETFKGRLTWGYRFASGVDVALSGTRYDSAGEERVFMPAFDDPSTNNGVAEDADAEDAGSLFLRLSGGGFTLEGAYVDRDRTSPSAPYGTVFNTDRTTSEDVRGYLQLRYDGRVRERVDLSAKLYYDDYHYRGDYLYDYAGEGEPPLLTVNRDKGDGQWWGGESHAVIAAGAHTLTVGGEYVRNARQDQENFDLDPATGKLDPAAVYLDDARDSWSWGLFLQDEFRLVERVRLTLGARYDRYQTFGGTLNPRAALVWSPGETTALKLLYGTAFRAPNFYELYYAAGENYKQNPDLDPEKIATYEAVIEQSLGSAWRLTAGAFHYRISNMISLVEDPADGRFLYDNTGGLKASGVELEAAGKWPTGFQAVASWSWQDVRDDATDEIVANSPRQLAQARLIAPLFAQRLVLGTEARFVGSRRTVQGGEADSYVLVNATLSTGAGWLGPVELALSAYNLFDAAYEDLTADDFAVDRVAQVGRTFLTRATVRF
ncbi:MAG TPA: TonB-dependent receptor [Candidatus Methanoperedens sp.]|nr:TonB-dependent receptor [Candidatus Methanoperedens sp.]